MGKPSKLPLNVKFSSHSYCVNMFFLVTLPEVYFPRSRVPTYGEAIADVFAHRVQALGRKDASSNNFAARARVQSTGHKDAKAFLDEKGYIIFCSPMQGCIFRSCQQQLNTKYGTQTLISHGLMG